MVKLYRQLVEAGWSVNDIENTDFDLLMSVVSEKETKKQKEVPLEDFLKRI